jgi:hypothetical protein
MPGPPSLPFIGVSHRLYWNQNRLIEFLEDSVKQVQIYSY